MVGGLRSGNPFAATATLLVPSPVPVETPIKAGRGVRHVTVVLRSGTLTAWLDLPGYFLATYFFKAYPVRPPPGIRCRLHSHP